MPRTRKTLSWRVVSCLCAGCLCVTAGCGGESGPPDDGSTKQADPNQTEKQEPAREAPDDGQAGDETSDDGSEDATSTTNGTAPDSTAESRPLDQATFDAKLAEIQAFRDDTAFLDAINALRVLRSMDGLTGEQKLELNRLSYDLRNERNEAAGLDRAVDLLASGNVEQIAVARRQLMTAGGVGLLFTRKAFREGDAKTATEAARILIDMHDDQSPDLFAERFADSKPGSDLRAVLYKGLAATTEDPKPAVLAAAVDELKAAESREARDAATYLIAVYDTGVSSDAEAFNKLAGNDDAFTALKDYVTRGMTHSDSAVRRWASQYAARLGVYLHGLHGHYYAGRDFDKLVHEQLDKSIKIPNLKYPFPDGRNTDLSVRWTGYVLISEPGEYTFYSASDDGQRVKVGEKMVVDDWNMHGVEERSGKIVLQPGLVPFVVEHMQGEGGGEITVTWEGPGFKRNLLDVQNLRTPPAPTIADQ